MPSGENVATGVGHKDWVAAVEFSPTGDFIATASGDSSCKVSDLQCWSRCSGCAGCAGASVQGKSKGKWKGSS